MSADPQFVQAQRAFQQGRLQDALQLIDALVRRVPEHADAWNLAGIVCQVRRDFDAAIRYYQRAIELGAGAGVLVNLGFAHQKRGEPELAMGAYAEAARREPRLAIAWQKQAGLLESLGRREEALAAFRQAVAIDPDDLRSLGDGLYLRRYLADWDAQSGPTPEQVLKACAAARRSDFSPTLLLSLPEADPMAQRAAAHKFAQSQWGGLLAAPALAAKARAHDGPLRVGYLSADFREHAVAFLVTQVIAAHDRSAVEVFAYGYRTPAPGDPWRQEVVAAADHFVDLDALDDRAAAQRIHADGIDVLVDLTGYTGHGRLGITAQRPAPVIASWLGYIGTLGEPRLADYVIGDAIATPLSIAPQFSEALALMPHGYQPNRALVPVGPPPTRADEGLPDDAVVFCSFNQAYKLNPPLWDDWCAILRGVPGSVLWLAPPRDALTRRNLQAETQARGVAPERLVFSRQRPRDGHLARLALADLALDTTPYNSGTTASDALRMGVPLLSVPGAGFVSRMATSLLHQVGLDDCVLPDRAALVSEAVALGRDAGRRGALRQRLQAALPQSRLFRPDLFARDLERIFLAMHRQALAGTHEHIVLAPAAELSPSGPTD